MWIFHNDYNEGCHPAVLEKILNNQGKQMSGYGEDESCQRAAGLIRKLCGDDSLSVHFLVGGTQANLTVIDAALRPHQGALGAQTAHINVHETGAVEATGHKVLSIPSENGKITACQIADAMEAHLHDESREHMVQPKLVYISNPTELGTIYSLSELEAISAVCRQYGLYLFVDGARLGYGLAASGNDVTMPDLARLCDVFYIGGTKVGALFGEAVVISNAVLAADFRYIIKQHGAMLAKGWLLGLQFEALLENGLYWQISARADAFADRIRATLAQLNYPLLVEGVTNQIFPILPNSVLNKLRENFTFILQERVDEDHQAVRFCTSWATQEEAVDDLCKELINLSK